MMRDAIVKALFVVAVTFLAGCTATDSGGPIRSEISTYDTVFTGDTYSKQSQDLPKRKHSNPGLITSSSLFKVRPESSGHKPYFIEFRARHALSYGHASVVFGKLGRNGKIPVNSKGILNPDMVQISGLHPATNDPRQWAKGHVVPVPAETGPSDGDFEDAYVTARFQINLTRQEFAKVVQVIKRHKSSYSKWYAPNYATNCLGYIGSIAKEIGLKVPSIPTMPKQYVRQLTKMNT